MERMKILEKIKESAKEGGKIILDAAGGEIAAKTKSCPSDLVTEFDRKVQETVIEKLKTVFPGAGFLAEEKGGNMSGKDAEMLFVIDPIDGTANFVHGFGHSCVSIACVENGEPVCGVVYDPYRDEMFSAEKGQGAFLNGQKIHVSEKPLSDLLVLVGTAPYDPELSEKTLQYIGKVLGKCQDIRRSGSAALDLCYVAAGRAGLYFEPRLSVWDYAAGALIVSEAGGKCATLSGGGLCFDTPVRQSMLAGTYRTIADSGLLALLL